MTLKIKFKRIYPGSYVSTNAVEEIRIEKNWDGDRTWTYTYGMNQGVWATKRDCVLVVNEILNHTDQFDQETQIHLIPTTEKTI